MDTLETAYAFGMKVASALNEAKVRPTNEGTGLCAVMTVVANDGDKEPLGGSVCWDKEREWWWLNPQVQKSERMEIDEEEQ
jgi:hypothetical protein